MNEEMPSAELRFHIGAHKTATTHLQDILAANRTYLLGNNILYLPRLFVRQMKLIQAVNNNYGNGGKRETQATSLETLIRLETKHAKRIVVSEENILGGCVDLLDCLYPKANKRLLPLSAIANRKYATIYISIRDHANILPSAFSETLRDGSTTLPFEAYRKKWLDDKPSWHVLVKEVRSLFSLATLVVWTFEKYVDDNTEILTRLTGIDLPKIDLAIPDATKSLSNDAAVRIQGINPNLDWPIRKQLIREIIESDKSVDKFNPLSIAEKSELRNHYEYDVGVIKKMDVEFLE